MKIETTGREIKAAMQVIKGVVNPAVVPWSATLLRVAEDGHAFLEACDGERSVRISLEETAGNQPGIAAVATRRLCEIASAMGSKEPANLEAVENKLVVTGASARTWTVPLIIDRLDDVVAVQAAGIVGETCKFSMPRTALARLLGRVSYAMSEEETRYRLNGVYFHATEGQLKTVATDGHRMGIAEMPLPEGAKGMAGAILPAATVRLLEKALAKAPSEEVTVTLAGARVAFAWPGFRLTTKLIDGTFPAYERVIPRANGCTFFFTTDSPILAAMKKGAPGRFPRAVLSLSETEGVKMEVGESEGVSSRQEDASAFYSGADIKIAFQQRYLRDLVAHLEGTPEFHFKDGREPALILDQGDPGVMHVLMPMRL